MVHRDEHNAIRVLKADPDLVRHLDPKVAAVAQRDTIAPVVSLPVGGSEELGTRGDYGEDLIAYLVIDGLLVHRVEISDRSGIELLGRGDLVIPRPCFGGPIQTGMPFDESWEVLAPARLAVLDSEFERVALRWPGVMARLLDRAAERVCTMSFYLALAQVPRVERRLVLLLWLLADRWGKVTPDGVELPLRLSHRMLGELASARRPSVTTALKGLADRQVVVPRQPAGWLLKGDPPGRLGAVTLSGPAAA